MKKLAVHFHLYYVEQLNEILTYLKSLVSVDHDLFITMAKDDKNVRQKITDVCPRAEIWVVPNKGYDVGPFLDFLHHIDLDAYEYILKIHTKGTTSKNYTWLNKHRLNNRLWRRMLLDALLKDENRVRENLQLMDETPKIGMLSSQYCVTDSPKTYQKLLPQINRALEKCGFHKTGHLRFVAGTMFYVRARLLKPLLKYNINDFEICFKEVINDIKGKSNG